MLSVSRIPGSLALLILFDPRVPASIWISCLLTAAIITTDFLDGNFARKYALESKLGYLLDGLGDRAFHVTIYLILLISGVISLVLAWALIFREVSQYAVRLADVDWHKTQSKLDRAVTRSYATAVQVIFACELFRAAFLPDARSAAYTVVLNLTLGCAAAVSYSRIIPRLWHAWQDAINA